MTEAVIPVTDLAFQNLGFEQLIFCNAVGNRRSHNIKLKTGATLVDVAPARFVDPGYSQREVWRLTKDDWLTWRRSTADAIAPTTVR